jgi:putative ABC transport system permease protein
MRLSRQDLTLAVRSFARRPGFTITAVLSLALAIALNTTMYSVLDALVNPEINARTPSRLYVIQTWGDPKHRVPEPVRASMLREMAPVAQAMTYTSGGTQLGVEYGNQYAQVRSQTIAPNYFDVMRIGPVRGRAFTDADLSSDMQPVIINEALAATLSPDRDFPIGGRIQVDGSTHVVVGIVRRGAQLFVLPTTPLALLPLNFFRLRDGVTQGEAEARLALISHRFAAAADEEFPGTGFLLKRADAGQFHLGNFHFALIAAVVAVLIIACANLANLQLARGIARSRELALRAALGASRRDIVVQLIVESATLAVTGLFAGLLATFWAMHFIEARIPPSVAEYVVAPRMSWRLFAFATLACLVSTMVIGLYPAIRVSSVDPNELLKGGAGTGASRKHRRQYGIMVATEIGLALALVSAAAIVVRTALVVRDVRMRYDPKPLATEHVYLRAERDTMISRQSYARDLLARVRAIPDVEDAALTDWHTFGRQSLAVEQRNGPPLEHPLVPGGYVIVTPSYLRTLRMPVVRGRDFLDGGNAEPEAIIDRAFARRFWPGIDPIGLRVKLDEFKAETPWIRVVGIIDEGESRAGQIRSNILATNAAPGEIFVTGLSPDSLRLPKGRIAAFSVVARAKSDPARLPVTLRRYVPPSPLLWLVTASSMEDALFITRTRQSHDFVASLFSLFAFLAVGLAALGVYGIVHHSVGERKRELGVRLALGATPRDIVHAVIREGNPMVLAGVALGLYLIKRTVLWLHGFSIEGDEYDAALFATMAALLFATALIAALIPAWRATKIDPVESLRSE